MRNRLLLFAASFSILSACSEQTQIPHPAIVNQTQHSITCDKWDIGGWGFKATCLVDAKNTNNYYFFTAYAYDKNDILFWEESKILSKDGKQEINLHSIKEGKTPTKIVFSKG
jgi:hypothetical protein